MKAFKVILPSTTKALTYKADSTANIGNYVEIEIRKQKTYGIIWQNDTEQHPYKIKTINNKINLPQIKQSLINFINFFIHYNIIANYSKIFKIITPLEYKYLLKQLAKIKTIEKTNINNHIKLSLEQEKVALQIMQYINNHKVMLLYGITGSGKTITYLQVVNNIIENNQNAQILILIPEIILTTQLYKTCIEKLGIIPTVWNSSILKKNRHQNWLNIIHGNANIIIGSRSALFLPYQNLKLIIVDEEHDTSFKQDTGIIYNARDMAIKRAEIENIPIILSSATPSVETLIYAQEKKYLMLKLTSRFRDGELPKIKLIDMTKNKIKNQFISEELMQALELNLKKNEQSLLFLNRRGYNQLTLCKLCGYRFCCTNCQVNLIQHKKNKETILKCHYCNNNSELPPKCPKCNKEKSIVSLMPGVEKISAELQNNMPNATIGILTSDTSKKKIESIVEDIINNKINIIIGTQIIIKGHNFPHLSLVGIIDGNLGNINYDLRIAEKTYQLLHQATGRAGRKIKNSEAMIQTHNTSNPLIQAIQNYDSNKFYQYEQNIRKISKMPPFAYLASIIVSGYNELETSETIFKISSHIAEKENIEIFGPCPAPIAKIKNRYRYRILLKSTKYLAIQSQIYNIAEQIIIPKKMQLIIDIDPTNFT